MKKAELQLLKVASKFQKKYGQSQSLQEILSNAAGYGEKSANGIMNFPAQLKKDQADLSFSVTISTSTFGGYDVDVSTPTVDPPEFAGNYARLPEQVKKYLDRNIKFFPQIPPGTTALSYSGKSPASGIAGRE